MSLKDTLKDHPAFAAVGSVVAVIGALVGVLALIEPKYELVTDEGVCGATEQTTMTRPHQWNECENPNRIVGYKFSETVKQSSGRVGGGRDEEWHCTNVKRAKEAAVGQSIVWSNQRSSQESDKSWDGHVTYKYHCTIDAQWGPIYARERWNGCGEAAPVPETRKIPKSCFDQTKRVGWKWKWE